MPIMANGFDRLEKLFTGTRRKDKIAQEKKILETKHVFPSPSFLRPTSIHMTPRDPCVEDRKHLAEDKSRSQSLSGPNYGMGWEPSERRSPKHGKNRRAQINFAAALPSPIEHDDDSCTAPRLSEFRFPEDALFMHDELMKISGNPSSPRAPSKPASLDNIARGARPTNSKRSLDYLTSHISSQFSPQLQSSGSRTHLENLDEADSFMLLPSPIITRSSMTKLRRQHSIRSISTTASPTTPSKQASDLKFSLFPKQHPTMPLISPPASDNGDNYSTSPFKRSISTTSLPTPDSSAASSLGSPDRFRIQNEEEDIQNRRETWETWCYRKYDPTRGGYTPKGKDGILRSRLLRKSASAATLSIVTSQIANEHILWEPTLDDFFGLSDDDIAESEEVAPALNAHGAPTPPPKDTERSENIFQDLPVGRSRSSINPLTGDITPPCTPINPDFLTLKCASCGVEGTQEAIWCARIAKKYHFDMVYVVSLWPNAARTSSDSPRRLLADSPNGGTSGNAPIGCPVVVDSKPVMTGRLLAGFGLDQVVMPFQIGSEAHLKRLKYNDWEEFRNQTAGLNELSHGWAHSFHSDHVQTADSASLVGPPSKDRSPDRGIVFAAYTKRKNKQMIPSRKSPEREVFFNRLLSDAETLVNSLIDWR